MDDAGPVVEAVDFQLQCDITNVAPARNLAVRWYIGNENFTSNGNLQELVNAIQTCAYMNEYSLIGTGEMKTYNHTIKEAICKTWPEF